MLITEIYGKNIPILIININNLIHSAQQQKFHFILILLSGVLFLPLQKTKSEELFLKCIGKYEVNRGALIKPDWETSYIRINMDILKSFIDEKGIQIEGRT